MPSFQERFAETMGQPIEYNGQILVMVDFLPVTNEEVLQLVFESVNSEWEQGIRIQTKGTLIIAGEEIKKAIIWRHTAPDTVPITVKTKDGMLVVYNAWDTGNGVIEAWHNGAAMIVEEMSNGRRYRCNDGHPDDNFDDLVFRIERVSPGKPVKLRKQRSKKKEPD